MTTRTHRPWLATAVDVWAMNSFSYLVSLPIEIIIAGMSWREHFQVRMVALVLNTLVARPFGLWRDLVFARFNARPNDSFLKLYLLDTGVFLSFQMPLYVGNMILGGAGAAEILKAAITVSLIAGLLGRPYGFYLDWLRTRVGLAAATAPVKEVMA